MTEDKKVKCLAEIFGLGIVAAICLTAIYFFDGELSAFKILTVFYLISLHGKVYQK